MLTYRPLERTDTDYELLVDIINSDTDVPTTVQAERDMARLENKELPWVREFALNAGKAIGYWSCAEYREHVPGKLFNIGISVHKLSQNQGFEFEMLSKALEHAVACGATRVSGAEWDYRTARVEAFERLGFGITQRDPSSKLDLESFDASRYEDIIARVEKGGIRFRTVSELARTTDAWIPLAHGLQCEVSRDVPGLEQHKPISLENFAKWMESPSYRVLEDWVIALDGEKWVGTSALYTCEHNPELALTMLTGVVRDYRRRGIATALKAKVLAGAKEAGVKVVTTGNEEHNPMLKLNIALGFVSDHTSLCFEKEIVRSC